MKHKNTSNYIKVMILTMALIVLGISATYAYFTSTISGDSTKTELKAGKLDIDTNLNNTNRINNPKIGLIDRTEKETKAEKVSFYINNTSLSTVDAKYFIYLKDIELSKNLYSEYFKWELVKNGEVIENGDFKNAIRIDEVSPTEEKNAITTVEEMTINQEAIVLNKNNTDNLIFRVWLENDENINQIDLTNGSFSGRLYLDAVPVSSK